MPDALNQVNQMRNQGMNDAMIIRKLRESGFSPRDINDALNQTQVRKEMSNQSNDDLPAPVNEEVMAQENSQEQQPGTEGEDVYYPQPQGNYPQQYTTEADYYSQGGGGFDTSTMIEVSEQVFSEKVQKIQSALEEIIEFKKITEARMEHLNERLRKIEMMIDNLQLSILQKVGSYGNNLDSVKKEMEMMQDSFRKMIPEMAEKQMQKRSFQPRDDFERTINSSDFNIKQKKVMKRK